MLREKNLSTTNKLNMLELVKRQEYKKLTVCSCLESVRTHLFMYVLCVRRIFLIGCMICERLEVWGKNCSLQADLSVTYTSTYCLLHLKFKQRLWGRKICFSNSKFTSYVCCEYKMPDVILKSGFMNKGANCCCTWELYSRIKLICKKHIYKIS